MNRTLIALSLLSAFALASCASDSSSPLSPGDASLAKPGSGTGSTDPLASWEFSDGFTDVSGAIQTSRLRGDSRDASGATSTTGVSTYTGGICGVHAKVFVENGGGDAVLDPDKNYKRGKCSGGARYLVFDLGDSSVQAGAFTNALAVWHLAPGESRTQKMQFRYNNITGCELLVFESDNGSSEVKVTRTDSGTGARTWLVESLPNSQGEHRAGCHNWTGGAYAYTGPSYSMAFHAQITEVQ